jgi:hypothetical protein
MSIPTQMLRNISGDALYNLILNIAVSPTAYSKELVELSRYAAVE